MDTKEFTRDPLILTLTGLALVFGLTAVAVLLILKSPQVESTTSQPGQELPVTSNPGSTKNLQAVPLQLQSGTGTGNQSDNGSTTQLQPQTNLTPEQLNNLQQ